MAKEYYIKIEDKQQKVCEEVYYAYKRPAWREHKSRMARGSREVSLDAYLEAGGKTPSGGKPLEEAIEEKLLQEALRSALQQLPGDERALMSALFYFGKTERDVAEMEGVSHQAVHNRKRRILAKLRRALMA